MPIEALQLPPEYRPGENATDPNLDLLDSAQKYSADAGPYATPIRACVSALLAARNTQWDVADSLLNAARYAKGRGFEQLADEAARDAGALGQDPAGARAALARKRTAEMTVNVRAQFKEQGAAIAEKCQTTMKDLKTEIDRARAKLAYIEIDRKGEPLVDLIGLDRLTDDIRSKGVKVLFDMYSSLSAAGDEDGCIKLERASTTWLHDELGADPKKRRFRKSKGGTQEIRTDETLEKENVLILRLLQAFEKAQAARTPPELLLAAQIFDDLLLPAYRGIVGLSSWDMATTPWNAAMAGNGRLPDPLALLDEWIVRNLPNGRPDEARLNPLVLERRGGTAGPPGWTALGNHNTTLGGRVRTPTSPIQRVVPQRNVAAVRRS